jgi:hypothetical protein
MIVSDLRHKTNSYKLMIQLGITQILGLQSAGLYIGHHSIQGVVFCSNPDVEYLTCCVLYAHWLTTTTTCDILGINRLAELYSTSFANKLFAGRRLYIWMAFPVVYGVLTCWFVTPVVWSSKNMAFFANPHFGYFDVRKIE